MNLAQKHFTHEIYQKKFYVFKRKYRIREDHFLYYSIYSTLAVRYATATGSMGEVSKVSHQPVSRMA